ncbi:hypothetical protein GE061_010169 [Apolygus lucorum]|uniref:Protein Wnt n=1 Tax=Apolygus lucorum TaxID=248454 RepID=A0A8S9Y2H0_APOLU|nr:hypothetical protein GE061_010169 [Apolygus lucorum]
MKPNLMAVSYVVLLVASSGDHYRRGRSIFEKRIEDVYWNSATSCDRPEVCSNRSSRSWIELAGRRAKLACESTFQYDRWGCQVGKEIFNKVSRESAALYALLSSSLAHEAATILAREGSARKQTTQGYPRGGQASKTILQQSLQQTTKYLGVQMKSVRTTSDLTLQARRHNAVVGMKILKQCITKSCKCHGFSGSCSMKSCWDTLPAFSVIAHRVRMKYLTAEKLKQSNRPRRALGHLEDAISVLDDSDDFCTNVPNRKCRDVSHCRRALHPDNFIEWDPAMEPIVKEENVVLKLTISKFQRSEDRVDEVILSRFNNSIHELVNGRIICHFRLQIPIDEARQLNIFYSYEPKFKHYALLVGSTLIILRKLKDSLVHHKTYSNVLNFTIADHLNLGKPQVVINLLSDEPPIITDCNNENHLSKPDHKLIQSFATLVQKSKLRIKNAEQILKEKTRILSKLSSTLAFNCDDDSILTTSDRLVYLKESLASGDVGLPAKGKALSVGEPWFKTHCSKWIIGFPVINVSKRDMLAFEMYVSHEDIIIMKTLLFTKSENCGASDMDVYQEASVLYEGKSGNLVAVLEEPHFTNKSFVLKCVCCFELSPCDSEQCYLGQIEIITLDFIGDKYRLPPVISSTQDIIAIQSSSKSSELIYQLLNITREQFIDTSQSVLKLKKIKGNVMVNTINSGNASRLLIFFDEYSENIVVYTDTSNDFLLLLHKLLDVFRGSVLFKHRNSHPARALEAMKKEMLYVKELLVNELVESDSNPKPPVELEDGANSCGQLGQNEKCEERVKPEKVKIDHLATEELNVKSISAGASHSFLLMHDGTVYGCGSNAHGQLVELSKEELAFKMIPSLSKYKIKQISTKWDTSYAVTSDGMCLAWGPNNYGQQGYRTTNRETIDNAIQIVTNRVKQVSAGLRHFLVLREDGSVFSAGDGKKGQLGRIESSDSLEKVPGLEGVVQVASGQNFNLARTDGGKIVGWGCNKFGQLGVTGKEVVNQPTLICEVPSTKSELLCGWTHSAHLDDKGRLTLWGRNKYCQLGVKQTPFRPDPQQLDFDPFKRVEFGSEHCLGITLDDEVVSWGWNEHGNCGTGDTANVTNPTYLKIGPAIEIGAGAGQSFAVIR